MLLSACFVGFQSKSRTCKVDFVCDLKRMITTLKIKNKKFPTAFSTVLITQR
uniref:Uncharacterized protein n=1 Tax=Rhizophora mucronata TaxID=61149 RepID=A0A2P2NWX1_RHIMU